MVLFECERRGEKRVICVVFYSVPVSSAFLIINDHLLICVWFMIWHAKKTMYA